MPSELETIIRSTIFGMMSPDTKAFTQSLHDYEEDVDIRP